MAIAARQDYGDTALNHPTIAAKALPCSRLCPVQGFALFKALPCYRWEAICPVGRHNGWLRGARHWAGRMPDLLARDDDSVRRVRHNNPSGKSAKTRPAPLRKIIFFTCVPDTPQNDSILPGKGRCARHDTRGGMRWTWSLRQTSASVRGRRSRVVLTPRCWRQVLEKQASWASFSGMKVARKPIAWESTV
jgi:hypothetical protein